MNRSRHGLHVVWDTRYEMEQDICHPIYITRWYSDRVNPRLTFFPQGTGPAGSCGLHDATDRVEASSGLQNLRAACYPSCGILGVINRTCCVCVC